MREPSESDLQCPQGSSVAAPLGSQLLDAVVPLLLPSFLMLVSQLPSAHLKIAPIIALVGFPWDSIDGWISVDHSSTIARRRLSYRVFYHFLIVQFDPLQDQTESVIIYAFKGGFPDMQVSM